MAMISEVHLIAHQLGLDLPTYTQDQRSVRSGLQILAGAAFTTPKRSLRTTLENVNIDLRAGDRLGLLGRNGAGKSTLLKVMVGAYPPTRGTLHVNGSIQALLNLSLGFNGDATLVENIVLRGIAMGLKPAAAGAIIDEVLAFAELHEKAGDRLHTLSSGQRMRLGFALATAVDHDILIMDEWIGAGDAAFVDKAQERLHAKVASARIVVLASHNLKLIENICNKSILLDAGSVVASGDVGGVVTEYRNMLKRG